MRFKAMTSRVYYPTNQKIRVVVQFDVASIGDEKVGKKPAIEEVRLDEKATEWYVGKKLTPYRKMIHDVFDGQDWWAQQLVQGVLENERAWKPVKTGKKKKVIPG